MKKISISFIFIILTSCFGKSPTITTGKEGKTMPAFNIILMDSSTRLNTITIPTGHSMVFFLFSPYCPYCRAQTNDIIEQSKSLSNIQFYFLSNFPFESIKKYYNEFHLEKYSNITVGQDHDFYLTNYLKADVVPYLAIYGPDKRLKRALKGRVNIAQIRDIALK